MKKLIVEVVFGVVIELLHRRIEKRNKSLEGTNIVCTNGLEESVLSFFESLSDDERKELESLIRINGGKEIQGLSGKKSVRLAKPKKSNA